MPTAPPTPSPRRESTDLSAIVLFFDAASTARIDGIADELAGPEPDPDGRRHLTLASLTRADPPTLERVVVDVASRMSPFDLAFPAVGSFFGADGVVYLAPALSPALFAAHTALHVALQDEGLEADVYTRPGGWVPHCTLAMGLDERQIGPAIDRVRSAAPIGEVHVVELVAVTVEPIEIVTRARLSGGEPAGSTA